MAIRGRFRPGPGGERRSSSSSSFGRLRGDGSLPRMRRSRAGWNGGRKML
jgi:hypothetical protein